MDSDFDIVVIGSGIAGLSAAVAAATKGARVAVLERAAPEEYGGNTRWTEAYFRMKSESEVSDDFEERLVANAGYHLDPHVVAESAGDYDNWPPYVKAHGMPDPELVGTLASLAGPTVAWLKTYGIRFDALPTYFVTAAAPRLMPVGGGLAMIEALRAAAEPLGVRFFYRTTARRLEQAGGESEGRRLAVLTVDAHGRGRTLSAGAVVIASGGFQGNTDADPLPGRGRPLRAPGGARGLLQPRRRHTDGAGRGRRAGGGFRLVPCRAAGPALGRARAAGHDLPVRHPGQPPRPALH